MSKIIEQCDHGNIGPREVVAKGSLVPMTASREPRTKLMLQNAGFEAAWVMYESSGGSFTQQTIRSLVASLIQRRATSLSTHETKTFQFLLKFEAEHP